MQSEEEPVDINLGQELVVRIKKNIIGMCCEAKGP